jgi:hypothetical protein
MMRRVIQLSIVLLILLGSSSFVLATELTNNCDKLARHMADMEDMLVYLAELDTIALSNEDQQMILDICEDLLVLSRYIATYSRQKRDEYGQELATSLHNSVSQIPSSMRSGDLDTFMEAMANSIFVMYDILHWCNEQEVQRWEEEHRDDD